MHNISAGESIQEFQSMVADPEKLHKLAKEGHEKLPWINKWLAISDSEMLFGKEKPDHGYVNDYSAGRDAVASFALLSVAYSHKEDIEKGTYTISDLFSQYPKHLKERQDAYDKEVIIYKESLTSTHANQISSFLANDQTGELGRNLLDDILSGEFSKQNGGHNPMTDMVPQRFSSPMSREMLLYKYTPKEMKKNIWENERACAVLKFNNTANNFVSDIKDTNKFVELSDLCNNKVQKGLQMDEMNEDGEVIREAVEGDPGKELVKNNYQYKELRTNTADNVPIIRGDGVDPAVRADEMLYFDETKQDEAYRKVTRQIQKDMSNDPDEKYNKLRETDLELMKIPARDYGRAMLRNNHLPKVATFNMDMINIQVPSKTARQELGNETFNKTVDMRIQANKEILTAIETEKLLAKSPAERQTEEHKKAEKKQLGTLWSQHRQTLQTFDALGGIDTDQFIVGVGADNTVLNRMGKTENQMEDGPNGQRKPVPMQKEISDTLGDNRDPRAAIGWIRGEKKAIENGWGLDELGLMGMIGRLEEESEGKLPDTLPQNDETRNKQKEFHEAVMPLQMTPETKRQYKQETTTSEISIMPTAARIIRMIHAAVFNKSTNILMMNFSVFDFSANTTFSSMIDMINDKSRCIIFENISAAVAAMRKCV